jgi:hypothetical protein
MSSGCLLKKAAFPTAAGSRQTSLCSAVKTNSIEQSPSWEANSHSASPEVPHLFWTWRFITMFSKACHQAQSWARWISPHLPPCFPKIHSYIILSYTSRFSIWGCIQKFLDWPPGARTENDTALRHQVQLYHYFVSQSSEFCHHNPLCCFSVSVYCCKHIFHYDSVRKLLDTPSYCAFPSCEIWNIECKESL